MYTFCFTLLITLFSLTFPSQGQDEPIIKCRREKKSGEIDYKVGLKFRTIPERGLPSGAVVHVYVKARHINDADLVRLASEFNRDFCKEDDLLVSIFTDKRYIYAISFPGLHTYEAAAANNRGYYLINRKTGEEYVTYSTVADYDHNPKSRIRIDIKKVTARP